MEEKLANVILGKTMDEDKFEIKNWGMSFKVGIKPLSPNKLVRLSKFLSRLPDLKDEEQSVFHAMTQNASGLKDVCKAIAIATDFPIKWFIYLSIMRLPLEGIEILMGILIKQSNANFFLNIMVLGKSQNQLKKKES